MAAKTPLFQSYAKLLTSVGGITGIMAVLTLTAGICGYLVVRSHINYLGLESLVQIPTNDYFQEGGKYLLLTFLLSFFWYLPLSYLASWLERKNLSLNKGLRVVAVLIAYLLFLYPLLAQPRNIIFLSNTECIATHNLFHTQVAVWLFALRIAAVVAIFILLLRHYRSQITDRPDLFYRAVVLGCVMFILITIFYGQQVYHKAFPVVDGDLTFSENLNEKVPQNDMILLNSTAQEVLLFQCSEHRIYQISKSSIDYMAFSGEKRVFQLNE